MADSDFVSGLFIRDDDEGLFSRDIDGQLVRLDSPTESDYEKNVTLQIDGLPVAASFNGGGVSTFTYDIANAEEMQVLVSGGLGEQENGGPRMNLVPRSGGNSFRGSAFYSTAGSWSTGNNIDDTLRAANIAAPPEVVKLYDVSGSLGGPIVRDKVRLLCGEYDNYYLDRAVRRFKTMIDDIAADRGMDMSAGSGYVEMVTNGAHGNPDEFVTQRVHAEMIEYLRVHGLHD